MGRSVRMRAPTGGNRTSVCTSRYGPSSQGATSWSRSTKPARCRRCSRPNPTISSLDPGRRFQVRSSRESSFFAMPAVRSPRSHGRATARPHGPRLVFDAHRRVRRRRQSGSNWRMFGSPFSLKHLRLFLLRPFSLAVAPGLQTVARRRADQRPRDCRLAPGARRHRPSLESSCAPSAPSRRRGIRPAESD